jgi:hypothetical protein
MLREAGYLSDEEGALPPASPLVVFRGQPAVQNPPGLSWSTNQRVAHRYGRDWSTKDVAVTLRATAPVIAVLARFSREDEVVVDSAEVINVQATVRWPHYTDPFNPPTPQRLSV